MIQLGFTKDLHTPQAIWFDSLKDPRPEEYSWHFRYEYLTEQEAEEMLNDPFVSESVKTELANALE